MREFVTAIKIEFSEAGAISTLGVSSRSYFQSLTGLVNRTWYPILKSGLSYRLELALPWDSGTTTQDVGDIILHNGGDAQYQYILDRLISGQVAGLNVDARRGYVDQAWDDLSDRIFVSQSAGKRFDGEELILPQRSKLAKLQQPIITEVFDETTPNPRLVNKTVPYLIGPAFQLEGLEFDAAQQQYYIAKNLANVSVAREGGARTTNFALTNTGVQMLAGVLKQLTFDAIGPAPADVGISQTTVVDWDFSAWTSDDPDTIDVTENPPEAEISETVAGNEADITVQATPTGDTGWVSLTNPFEPVFATLDTNAAGGWTAVGAASVEDAVVADDGSYAEATIFGETTLRVAGFAPAVPAGYAITGCEVEVIAQSDNDTEFTVLTVNQTNPGTRIASYIGTAGSGIGANDLNGGAKTTLTGGGANFIGGGVGVREDTTAEDVNPGCHFTLKVRPRSTASETIQIYQVRIKLHYAPTIDIVRLFSPTAVLEPGERHTVTITEQSADIYARFGGSTSSGGELKDASDPFSTSLTKLEAGGSYKFDFVPDKDQTFFGIEFKRLNSAGTAVLDRIKVEKRADGRTKYKTQVPYVAGLIGLDDTDIDQDAIDAHDEACGSPEMGWYVRGNESMTEWLDLTARMSLSGAHWVGRDGKLRSMLWVLAADATPDYRIENIEVDGQRQRTRIVGRATLQSEPAPMATERAVGARNWRPLRFNETAGITETFTPQDRANVTEDWRVRRRANFDSLDPWEYTIFTLALTSISPTSGSEAGGDTVTATGTFDTGQAISFTVGGTAATSPTVVNATTATFVTPAGTAGTVDVVATQGAQSATLVNGFEYTAAGVQTTVTLSTAGAGTWTVPTGVSSLDELHVIAGGGGGGGTPNNGWPAGGGGGGGVVEKTNYAVTGGASIAYTIGAGGAGGAAGSQNPGAAGSNSVFDGLTAIGGGGGTSNPAITNRDGGSGGGGSDGVAAGTGLQPGSTDGGLGNNGGAGSSSAGQYGGGGGGGAVSAGVAGTGTGGGDGGSGTVIDATTYASGGGGGSFGADAGAGGAGAGDGGTSTSRNGGAATTAGGGGGGAGATAAGNGAGGAGADGSVIIKYTIGSTLPVTSGLVARLDASDLALTDGDPVTLWADASGNGHDADNNTNATYKASVGAGHPAVHIGMVNGSEIKFTSPYLIATGADLTAVYIMVPLSWNGANPGIWRGGASSNHNMFHIFNGSTSKKPWIRWGSDVLKSTAATPLVAGNQVMTTWLVESGAKAEYWIGNTLEDSATHSNNALSTSIDRIGWQSSTGERFEAYYHEILYYNRPLTPAEISDLDAYAKSKWGTP